MNSIKLISLLIILYISINSCTNNSKKINSYSEFNVINNIGIRVINYNISKDIINKILRINGQIEIKNLSQSSFYGHGCYRVMLKDKKGNIVQMHRSEDEEIRKIIPYLVEPRKSNIQYFDGGLYTNKYNYVEFAIKWDGNELFKSDKSIITRWIKYNFNKN
jgi:hypothetical protein